MKHPGSCSEFSAQRNAELLRAYRNVLSKKSYFNVNSDFNMVVNEPCSRFWISEERAMIVVSAMLRGENRSTCRCIFDMFMGGGELCVVLLHHLISSSFYFLIITGFSCFHL